MTTQWKKFLINNGASLQHNFVKDFGKPEDEAKAALSKNIIMDLSYFAIVEISGSDAEEFLHGLFTSDIKKLDDECFQFSAWCNPKGRVLANFIVVKLGEIYYLILPDDLKAQFIKKLQIYILRSEVSISDHSSELIRLGILAKDIEHLMMIGITDSVREQPSKVIKHHDLIIIALPGKESRMFIFGPEQQARQLWQKLAEDFLSVGSQYWQLHDILSGIAWISEQSSESFLPQTLNLDCLDGVSLNKGCYTGQEIIARMHYRGKLKQRMFLANIKSAIQPETGAKLYSQHVVQSVGMIINAARYAEKDYQVLVAVDMDQASDDNVHLHDASGPLLNFHALPYPIETG